MPEKSSATLITRPLSQYRSYMISISTTLPEILQQDFYKSRIKCGATDRDVLDYRCIPCQNLQFREQDPLVFYTKNIARVETEFIKKL